MATIIVITQRVPFPPNKGEKLRTFHQLQYLKNLGFQLIVFSPVENERDLADASALSHELGIELVTQKLASKLIRYATGLVKRQSLSEANFYSNALLKKIQARVDGAHAILCSASSLANYVFKLSLSHKPILLMDFMDVDSDKWLQYARGASAPIKFVYQREHRLIQRLERKVVADFDTAFLIAEAERELFYREIAQCQNLLVLGNGINQDEFTPAQKAQAEPGKRHFLFTGVMDYKPNVDAVLWFVAQCWPQIQQAIPDAHFTIAGMNPEPKISALARQSGIEVTGFVDDIMPYFARADVFVAPFQIARGVQNKVLQAMSCAIPVVSTRLGAEGIMAEHQHNMLIADTDTDFIEACINLCEQEALRKSIGLEATKTIAQHYSWESVLAPLKQSLAISDT